MNRNHPSHTRRTTAAALAAVLGIGLATHADAVRQVTGAARANVSNVNVNRNVNRNVNVNVDRRYDHPIATAVAVTTAVAATTAIIGSMVRSLPPSCSPPVMINGFAYQNCGNVWYQPQYAGTQVTYVVVNPPR